MDGIKIPLYLKMYLVKIKNTDDNYLKRQMINKAILKSYVTDTPLDRLDLLTLSNYEKYLDPSNYTSEQEYMIMYIEAKIKNLFGISYDTYINSTIDRIHKLYNIGKLEVSKQNHTLDDLSNELGELANGL